MVSVAAATERACTVKFDCDLSLVSANTKWEDLVVDLA